MTHLLRFYIWRSPAVQTGWQWCCEWSTANSVEDDGMPQHITWTEDEPWWESLSSCTSLLGTFEKIVFALSRCRIARTKFPKSCSPTPPWCTVALGIWSHYISQLWCTPGCKWAFYQSCNWPRLYLVGDNLGGVLGGCAHYEWAVRIWV